MRGPGSSRAWIWVAVLGYVAGLAFDIAWHGVLYPGFEAVSVGEMARHLGTVHLPIYIGVVGVLLATVRGLFADVRRGTVGVASPVAAVGAVIATAGEAWHAYTHLRLSTHAGPMAAATSFLGLLVVVGALWLERRHRRRRTAGEVAEGRRAA